MSKYIGSMIALLLSISSTTLFANNTVYDAMDTSIVNTSPEANATLINTSTEATDVSLVSTSNIENGEPIGVEINGARPCHPPYTFILDNTFSAIVGAKALVSALYAYEAIDDAYFPSTEGSTDWLIVIGRFGKYILEGTLFSWGMVAQHEVFGHGARAREFNMKVYNYNVLPWSGHTSISYADIKNASPSERNALYTGGVESTYILAKQLRNNWLESKYMDEREGHAYIITALDQTLYVLNTNRRHGIMGNDDGDISRYIHQLNKWYGHTVITSRDLRQKILFDFLDPYFFFSLYSIGHYIGDGTMGFEYPMFSIGNYHYLPGFRIALAPYGPEYQFINYIRGCDHTLQVTLRYGNTNEKRSYGLAVETYKLWSSDLISIDTKFDIWSQPKLFTRKAYQSVEKFGIAAVLIGRYRIGSCFDIIGQLGYKTSGYIPGEFLRRTPILRIGFSLQI